MRYKRAKKVVVRTATQRPRATIDVELVKAYGQEYRLTMSARATLLALCEMADPQTGIWSGATAQLNHQAASYERHGFPASLIVVTGDLVSANVVSVRDGRYLKTTDYLIHDYELFAELTNDQLASVRDIRAHLDIAPPSVRRASVLAPPLPQPEPAPPVVTSVYRHFTTAGDLLYVGISCDPGKRTDQHAKVKRYWDDVEWIHVTNYPTREEARAAELEAIRTEAPRYNIADVPKQATDAAGCDASENEEAA